MIAPTHHNVDQGRTKNEACTFCDLATVKMMVLTFGQMKMLALLAALILVTKGRNPHIGLGVGLVPVSLQQNCFGEN